MVLGFKKRFVEPILNGTKIHTIREDKRNRWKVGNKIHFATGVRTKSYNQFAEGEVSEIFHIRVYYYPEGPAVDIYPWDCSSLLCLTEDQVEELAKNDGFNSTEDFFDWFDKDFEGKLICWQSPIQKF